jgi:hypothetical protein
MSLQSLGSKNKPNKESAVLATCFHAGFLLVFFFEPEDGGDIFLRNVDELTFNGLHGVISQKIELFIPTAVRTSNPNEIL